MHDLALSYQTDLRCMPLLSELRSHLVAYGWFAIDHKYELSAFYVVSTFERHGGPRYDFTLFLRFAEHFGWLHGSSIPRYY